MKLLRFLSAMVAFASFAQAQPSTSPGQVKRRDVTPDQTVARATMDNAKALAKGRNIGAAEQALATLNHAKPNSAAWHIETAHRLVQTVEQIARDGETGAIAELTARALSHLEDAKKKAKDVRVAVAAATLAGFIQERYLADSAAALASYEAAVQLAPEKAANAKHAAERLRQTEENLKARGPKGSE